MSHAAGLPGSAGHDALASLCERYWPPLYAYSRRLGYSPSDGQDLTQAFFVHLLENRSLRFADPARGRFRTFLLSSFQNFLTNEWHRGRAIKRGGGRVVSLDFQAEEARLHEPADVLTPDAVFERRWALTVLERALDVVRNQWSAAGKQELFDGLKPLLMGETLDATYRELAIAFDTTEGALKVTIHRLRRQFARALREQILDTVSTSEEVDDEIRYLRASLAAPAPPAHIR